MMMASGRSNVPGLLVAFSASVTTGGTIYAFGIYGDALKKQLGLTQLQLESISATFFIAGLFTWMPLSSKNCNIESAGSLNLPIESTKCALPSHL